MATLVIAMAARVAESGPTEESSGQNATGSGGELTGTLSLSTITRWNKTEEQLVLFPEESRRWGVTEFLCCYSGRTRPFVSLFVGVRDLMSRTFLLLSSGRTLLLTYVVIESALSEGPTLPLIDQAAVR